MATEQASRTWTLSEYVGGPRDGELSASELSIIELSATELSAEGDLGDYVLRSNPPHLGARTGWERAMARAILAFGNGTPDAYARMIWDGANSPSASPAITATETNSQVDRLLHALRSGEDYEARLIAAAFCVHTPAKTDLIELLLAPAIHRIQKLWVSGAETTYVQHRAAAIVHGILGDHSAASPQVVGQRVAVARVTGETHSLPARMAAVVLREDGWQVEEVVGPLTPQELTDAVVERQLDLVVLSATAPKSLPAATQVQQLLEPLGIPVIIGTQHRSFYEIQRLARRAALTAAS